MRIVTLLVSLWASVASWPAGAQLRAVPMDELADSVRIHRKPALILITTGWCSYCRIQKAQLDKGSAFRDASPYIYFAEFDAETREDLVFNGTTYQFRPTGMSTGSHELAFALGNIDNRLAYPTWVLVNEDFEIAFRFPGVLKPAELSALLKEVRKRVPPE